MLDSLMAGFMNVMSQITALAHFPFVLSLSSRVSIFLVSNRFVVI